MGLMPTNLKPGAAIFSNGQVPADAGASMGDGQSNVAPEEQALYETVVEKGAELIYGDDDTVEPAVLQALQVAPTPETPESGSPHIMALANAAFQIIRKLDESSREQNQPIPDDILYHAGVEIIEELGEVARAASIHDYSEEELTGALYQCVDLFRPYAIESGRTDEDTLKGQFGEIQQADQEGRLGEVLPGMESGEPAAPVEE